MTGRPGTSGPAGGAALESLVVQRGFANTPEGQIHYAAVGSGRPVVLLHQTPRSWDEYREVLPLLGGKFRAIAMDTVGFGDSYRPVRPASMETYARAVVRFMDVMGIGSAALVGHHTGGCIAVEVAASHPERVDKLVLSSTPYVDAADRERRRARPPIDQVETREDGGHLGELWRRRMAFYPKGRPELLTRFVRDALTVWERVEEGHHAVNRYRMEDRTPLIRAPTLVLCGTEDPFSYPRMIPLARSIKGATTAELKGGMVPMVDQMPEEFARVIMEFLA